MKPILLLLGLSFLASLMSCQGTPEPAPSVLDVSETHHGFAWIGELGVEGGWNDAPMLIRDAESFERFRRQIPVKQITKTQPAPPSEDPLLKAPVPDFDSQMVLVAFYPNTVSRYSEFGALEVREGRIHAHVTRPARTLEDDMVSRPLGLGTYTAVYVNRADGEPCFTQDCND